MVLRHFINKNSSRFLWLKMPEVEDTEKEFRLAANAGQIDKVRKYLSDGVNVDNVNQVYVYLILTT